MRIIPLTQGHVAYVDDQDGWLADTRWYYRKSGNTGYAQRARPGQPNKSAIIMHRVILEAMLGRPLVKGEEADHINGNGTDNRRENLRVATRSENLKNRQGWGKTEYKGVFQIATRNLDRPWFVQLSKDKRRYRVGGFRSPIQAAAAYDLLALRLHGEFARLNLRPKLRAQVADEEVYDRLSVVAKNL